MKKLLLTVLAISMCYTINAQEDKQQIEKIKFGVKAGVNLANVSGNGLDFFIDSDEKSENRFGLAIGGLVEYKLSQKISLQGELVYSQQGFKKNYPDEDFMESYALDYLNIPVLAKYYITDELNLEFGPQLGFLLAAKYIDEEDGEKYEEDAKEFFKSTDFGLNFGAGYQLENGLGINARYNLGLANIFDYSRTRIAETKFGKVDEEIEDNFQLKNRVFSISLFYTF